MQRPKMPIPSSFTLASFIYLPLLLDDLADQVLPLDRVAFLDLQAVNLARVWRADHHFLHHISR